jgi:hypothetical protein
MLAKLLRPLLNRLFWTRRRVGLIIVGLFALLVIGGQLASAGARSAQHAAARPTHTVQPAAAPTTAQPAAPRPSSSPPSVPSSPPPSPAPPAALRAGQSFATAWVSRRPHWAARLRPYVTAQLAAQLAGQQPKFNPATRVTGQATVTGAAPSTVDLSIPTDAGPALVTVHQRHGRWRAESVMLARTGD